MSKPGMGAMLHYLSGGSRNSPETFYGLKVLAAVADEKSLRLGLEGGITIKIWDDGQSCCENRYMTCDDNVQNLIGGTLRKIDVREIKETKGEWDEHEIAFLEVGTDECSITVCTHNEHNGYYGGFGLTIDVEQV